MNLFFAVFLLSSLHLAQATKQKSLQKAGF
jgi:hypothetical protein